MRKIAIFTEGQSEQIFVRYFLPQVIGWDKISFGCFKLRGDEMDTVLHNYPNENAEVYFWIVNVGNDERVLSVVKEHEESLFQKGYEKIIALRDMYSKAYRDRAGCTINDAITMEFINGFQETIYKMSYPDKVKMCFAIMELEAWFLGMYNIFERLNPALNIAYIEEKLGFNLAVIDPQTTFFKPTDDMDRILKLVELRYQKKEHDVESLCSKMGTSDFTNALENGRCGSFKDFYDEMLDWMN